eukprot:461438_1
MAEKHEYAELHHDSVDVTNELKTKTTRHSKNVISRCIDLVRMTMRVLLRGCEFFGGNKTGVSGLIFVGITIIIISFIIHSKSLPLSESHVYDYRFIDCNLNGEKTMCPSYELNHTIYFVYDGAYISPYVEKGQYKDTVFFRYDFCKQVSIPQYPANYQRHCNLMSAGIGTKVSVMCGFTLSIITLFHLIIILMGYCPWNMFHKLNWITAFISALCYVISCLVWHFIGHIDIISNNQLYSEAFAGMKIETKHGNAIILTLISAFISFISTFCLKYNIWTMKIEDFRLKYTQSETSSQLLSSADLNFINEKSDEQSIH